MSDNKKIVFLPYDMDTAIGTNNEGELVFSYNLEDTDHQSGGADVFNGQQSVLWNNIRDAFGEEIAEMYRTLRNEGALSYEKIEKMFEDHQSKWSENIFNEDAQFKYIDPYLQDGTDYLGMLLGSKEEQRKWWLYNRFRYMDSKFNAGDALSDTITLRPYAVGNISVTPYADIYTTVNWDGTYDSKRTERGTTSTHICPYQAMNDNVVIIHSASQLASIGDLSALKLGLCDISNAVRLQSLIVGSAEQGYSNPNMRTLALGNNVLMKVIDARNCVGLGDTTMQGHTQQAVDASGCSILEEAYFEGTKITGLSLPNGGVMKVLHLPNTIKNLTVMNHKSITDFQIASYANVEALRLEGTNLDMLAMLRAVNEGTRVRLVGFEWELEDAEEIEGVLNKLDKMRGIGTNGEVIDIASGGCKQTIIGKITTDFLTGSQIASYKERYPYIEVTAQHTESYIYYYNGTTLVNTEKVLDGGNGTYTGTPSKSQDAQYTYAFAGWSKDNDNTVDDDALVAIVADRNVYACYTQTLRKYNVTFVKASADGGGTLQTVADISYGTVVTAANLYTGATPTTSQGSAEDYPFEGWEPTSATVTGPTTFTAKFGAPEPEHTITDTWEEIFEHIQLGDYATRYSIGDTKSLDLGSEGYINMQIVAFDADTLESDETKTAPISWVSEHVLNTPHRFNPELVTNYIYEDDASFKRYSSIASNTNYNCWNAQNRYVPNNTAKITFTVTAVTDGTLRIDFLPGSSVSVITSLKIDGTDISFQYAAGTQSHEFTITNGTTYVIEYEITTINAHNNILFIKLCNTDGSGSTNSVNALVSQSEPIITNCQVQKFDSYEIGTGTIGGFANSELRTYLKNTIKPLIPENVRNHIVPVKKYTRQLESNGEVNSINESFEDIWIPSARELNTTTPVESKGPKYSTIFSDDNSRKKRPLYLTPYQAWWSRTAFNVSQQRRVQTSGTLTNNTAVTAQSFIAIGFCTD